MQFLSSIWLNMKYKDDFSTKCTNCNFTNGITLCDPVLHFVVGTFSTAPTFFDAQNLQHRLEKNQANTVLYPQCII